MNHAAEPGLPDRRVAGVVLAAGSGSRMGTPKAGLVLEGRSLLDRAVATLVEAGCVPVVAVARPGEAATGPAGTASGASSGAAGTAVVNPDPERGMRSSLELGVAAAADSGGVEAVAVVLVDVPGLSAAAVADVVAGWRPGRIAVGVAAGRRTHPTVMAPDGWREAIALAEPDEGARRYLRAHPELVDEIPVDIDPTDLDTPEDLAAWPVDRLGDRPSTGSGTV